MIKSIPLDYKISGTKIFLPFEAICSVTNKSFSGNIIIEYHPHGMALEYVDAEKVTNNITSSKITAEDLAHLVFNEVEQSIKPKYIKVTIDVKHSEAHRPVEVWVEN
jgi:NADPH-dependent 7-cyano-7-deazaguanine reductase QueF